MNAPKGFAPDGLSDEAAALPNGEALLLLANAEKPPPAGGAAAGAGAPKLDWPNPRPPEVLAPEPHAEGFAPNPDVAPNADPSPSMDGAPKAGARTGKAAEAPPEGCPHGDELDLRDEPAPKVGAGLDGVALLPKAGAAGLGEVNPTAAGAEAAAAGVADIPPPTEARPGKVVPWRMDSL